MENALQSFEKRHRAVTKRHRQLARGYVTKMGRNGLIEHQPRRNLPGLSPRSVVLTAFAFFSFKAFLLHTLGETEYVGRVDLLAEGSVAEKAGAFVLQIDVVTRWIVEQVVLLLT